MAFQEGPILTELTERLERLYYIHTKRTDGEYYEVHNGTCRRLPLEKNRIFLGEFDDCELAVMAAKELGIRSADGCWHCSEDCHSG